MKKLDKRAGPGSTPQPRSDFNWPPTDEEVAAGLDTSRSAHERLRAYFNWPPDDEEPPAAAAETPRVTSEEPRSAFNGLPVDEGASPGVGIVPEPSGEAKASFNWPPPDEPVHEPTVQTTFERSGAGIDRQPDDSVFASAPIEAAASTEVDDTTPDVAATEVAEVGVGLDGLTDGQWEVEIARLQALLDGLTEKLEWRTTGGIGNDPQLKH
jgi:hypothetical protein